MKLVRNIHWPAIVILAGSAYIAILFIDGTRPDWRFAGISRDTMTRLAGSLLSSAIFLTFTQLLLSLKGVSSSAEADYFQRVHDYFGVKEVFDQRGGVDALASYEKHIRAAKRRLWAIGMTNQRFLSSHFRSVLEAARRSADIDIRIAFADPRVEVALNGERISGIDVQMRLEQKPRVGKDWDKYLGDQIERFRSAESLVNIGHLRLFSIASVCYLTCFVIDDDVYFFPMLARRDSSQDPTVLVGSESALGRVLIDHFAAAFQNDEFCKSLYDNRSNCPKA